MRIRILLTLVFVFALVLAGCGGGAEQAAPAEAPAAEEPAATEAPAAEEPAAEEPATEEPAAEEEDAGEEMAMAEGEINMARATWDTGWFQAAIFETILEELGYEVNLAGDLPAETFYPALARGDVDFWPNGWLPLHQTFIDSDVVAGQVEPVGYQVAAGALQGFLVDKASAEELGITSLADFTDPEIAAVFDTDGDGKADLTGCDAGWGCEGEINRMLGELELEDTVTHVQGTYSLLMADTIARYQRGEPIFFYTWTPNWTVSELQLDEDVVWITVPGSEASEDVPGCVADPCAMGFVANDIRVVANSEWLAENPAARVIFEQVEIPLNDIAEQNQLMVDGQDGEDDIAMHAAEWIEEHSEEIEQWLDAARAEL